eukprot:3161494-Prorocentrum_lima.AAC.1
MWAPPSHPQEGALGVPGLCDSSTQTASWKDGPHCFCRDGLLGSERGCEYTASPFVLIAAKGAPGRGTPAYTFPVRCYSRGLLLRLWAKGSQFVPQAEQAQGRCQGRSGEMPDVGLG